MMISNKYKKAVLSQRWPRPIYECPET